MNANITTREFLIDDYEMALDLWNRVEGIEIAEGDDKPSIAEFLRRNPGLSRLASDGTKIVGIALCGHDGHRGHIYHLAVDPASGGRGIGSRLVDECMEGLSKAGLQRAIILVAQSNPGGQSFWKRCGWEEVEGAIAMGKDLIVPPRNSNG